MRTDRKVALITGASRGIGAALVKASGLSRNSFTSAMLWSRSWSICASVFTSRSPAAVGPRCGWYGLGDAPRDAPQADAQSG
jgi:hypothetical protein